MILLLSVRWNEKIDLKRLVVGMIDKWINI